jgi:hypothetical protein
LTFFKCNFDKQLSNYLILEPDHMKKIVFLGLFVMSIIIGCTQQQVAKSPLEGAWKVVLAKQMHGDTVVFLVNKDIDGNELKIWSGNYYNYVGRWSLNDSTRDYYEGGTFRLEGNRYLEQPLYPAPNTYKMLLEIKNDTITQIGPVDDNGVVNKSNYLIEKFARLK